MSGKISYVKLNYPASTTWTGTPPSLCIICKHLISIDVDGHVDCSRGVKGFQKVYCSFFEMKENEQ